MLKPGRHPKAETHKTKIYESPNVIPECVEYIGITCGNPINHLQRHKNPDVSAFGILWRNFFK